MTTLADKMTRKCAEMVESLIEGGGGAKGVGTETADDGRSVKAVTMTQATECIWGSSGKGNPNAKKMIESLAAFGYVDIETKGRISRVRVTFKGFDLFFSDWRTL